MTASSEPPIDAQTVQRLTDARKKLKTELAKVVVGQDDVIDQILVALLCRGHALMVGVPGLGKTLMARTLSRALDMQFSRIQFTPDLMPSDITGTDIIEEDPESGRRKMEFLPGPVFANFLLADEINRAPPKTQAALLQAMQEREVSIGRKTYQLQPPFFVVATQNPIEQEGTYPLPEAQLDRFMLNIPVTYPTQAEESQIVKATTGNAEVAIDQLVSGEEIRQLQRVVREVPVADSVVDYAVNLSRASRPGEVRGMEKLHHYVRYGASPRASQNLILGAKAKAVLNGKFHVDFSDVQEIALPVLRHRVAANFHAKADQVTVEEIIHRIVEAVPCR